MLKIPKWFTVTSTVPVPRIRQLVQSLVWQLDPKGISPWFPPSDIHDLCNLPPLSTGRICDLLWSTQYGKVMGCQSLRLGYIVSWRLRLAGLMKHAAMSRKPTHSEELQLTINKKSGPSVIRPQDMLSANNLNELESRFLPSQAPRWKHSLADTLISAF